MLCQVQAVQDPLLTLSEFKAGLWDDIKQELPWNRY